MFVEQSDERLRQLRLSGMLRMYRQQRETAQMDAMSFDERFAFIIEAEWQQRQNSRIDRLIKQAGFKERAELSAIIYKPERNLDRQQVAQLALNQWIERHENLIITGPTGCGKSYLAQALGVNACRTGLRVSYYRIPGLLTELNLGRHEGNYRTVRRQLQRQDLLILDDWGMAQLDRLSGHEILEILEDRFRERSTIVISQFPIQLWNDSFEDPTTADAIFDRLVSIAYRIELGGPSLRKEAASRELIDFNSRL